MGQFSMEISGSAGSVLSGNQQAKALGTSIVEGVKAAFVGIGNWFADLFGGIFTAIKNEVIANLKAVAELIPEMFRPQALDDWIKGAAPAAKASAPAATAIAADTPRIPAASLPAVNGGIPAPAQAVMAQPVAEVASGPSGADAAVAEMRNIAASIEAALAKGGIVKVDTSVRVKGGQVTGNSVTATGIARAGDVGVQEMGAD